MITNNSFVFITIVIVYFSLGAAFAATSSSDLGIVPSTCLQCAEVSTNKMCLSSDITFPPNNKIKPKNTSVVCCQQDDTADYCKAKKSNKCSSQFSQDPQRWYSFCP